MKSSFRAGPLIPLALAAKAVPLTRGIEERRAVGVRHITGAQSSRSDGLDNMALLHDGNTVAELRHHSQIMRYEQVRHTSLFTDMDEEAQYLGLHRHIERRSGLVQQQELGLQGQGTGNTNTLALAT